MNKPAVSPSCRIRVYLLGPLEVTRRTADSWQVVPKEEWGKYRKTSRRILGRLLAAPGRRLGQGRLLDDLWPETDSPGSLNNGLTAIRNVIGDDLLTTIDTLYQVAGQDLVWVDLDACKALLKEAENQGCTTIQAIQLLEEALSYLERGTCFEGEEGQWHYGLQAMPEAMLKQCRWWLAQGYEQQGKFWQASDQYRTLCTTLPPDEEALQGWMMMLHRRGKTQEALKCYHDMKGFVEAQGFTLSSVVVEQFVASLAEQSTMRSNQIIIPGQDLEEQHMGLSRRNFLYLLGAGGIEASGMASQPTKTRPSRSFQRLHEASIHELATLTTHLRILHQQGDIPFSHELYAHLSVIQHALHATLDDNQRHDLWRLLAQTQLLCQMRLSKQHSATAKTFSEAAVASARNSGDRALVGAAIGHLAHFYLRIEKAPAKALQLFEEAQTYVRGQRALSGWFALVLASLMATGGDGGHCEKQIHTALEAAHDTQDVVDPYFTDFSLTSVYVFAGNSWLTVGQPQKAYEWLMKANVEDLSPNRHASTYYDIARAYTASHQLEAAQAYALKSMDCAVATNNLYIIPRFITLANAIQQQYPDDVHASVIGDYARSIAYA